MSGYLTVDNHIKKKKRKTGDRSLSENVSYSEHAELEGSGKKKKKKNKHRNTDDETLTEVSSLDNLSPSYSRRISAKFKEQEDTSEQVLSNQDYNSNTPKSPKKSKKKKRIEVSVEEAVEETDHTGQPSLYDGHSYSDEVAVSEEAIHSKSVRKKKKRHRSPETRSLEEEVLEDVQQTSSEVAVNLDIDMENSVRKKKKKHKYNELLEKENLGHGIQETFKLSSQCPVVSKKSKQKGNKESVEEAGHTSQPSLYDGHSDQVAISDEACHSESVRKKKKKHKYKECLEEENLNESEVSVVEAGHTGQLSLYDGHGHLDEVAISEEAHYSESVRKKKKKHKFKGCLEEENLNESEVSVVEAGHTGQPSLYDSHGHSDEVAVSEETLHSESVREKKKRHRPSETRSLEEEVLENVQETSPLVTVNEDTNVENSVRKKKKKHKYDILEKENLRDDIQQTVELSNRCPVASKKSRQKNKEVSVEGTDLTGQPSMNDGHSDEVSEEALHSESPRKKKKKHRGTRADSTFSDEREPITVGCQTPNARNSEKVTVTEDMSPNESSERKKKKKKHRTREVDSQTESSICKRFKRYASPEPKEEDAAVAEGSENEERGKNLDATEETFENIEETTKSIKLEISEGNQDQDVTAELAESDKTLMETTLDEDTSDQRKNKANRPKRRGLSADALFSSIPERDIALLEEYFPRIRSMAARTVEDLIGYELQRIKKAKEQGIKFETGRFDSTEDELIKKNVEAFKKLIGLESGEMLFHSYRFPDEKSTIEKLKKKYHFRQRIAMGVARTVKEVQNRGSKLYDLSGNKGRFTKEDIEKLQKGMSKYGNNWTAVGNLVGRNRKNTQLKASQLRNEFTGGKWSNEEVNRLIKAVKKFILRSLKKKKGKDISRSELQTVPKEMLFSGIPWAKIEEKVKTRNWTHCKSKWNDVLLVRMNNGIRYCERLFGLQANIDIIKWLHEAELPKGRVNWLKMAKDVGNIPPGILQQKVYKLKARNVPDWQRLGFKEIVDYLYKEVLPKLEARVNISLTSQDTLDLPEKKDEFLIRDIFEEYVGDGKFCLSNEFCDEN